MAINDRQGDGHGTSVNHDPRSRQSDDQMSADGSSPAVARAAATFTALVRAKPGFLVAVHTAASRHAASSRQSGRRAAVTALTIVISSRHSLRCELACHAGPGRTGRLCGQGPGSSWRWGASRSPRWALWAVSSRGAADRHLASASAASPASGSPRRTRCPRYAIGIRRRGAVASPVWARFTRPRQIA